VNAKQKIFINTVSINVCFDVMVSITMSRSTHVQIITKRQAHYVYVYLGHPAIKCIFCQCYIILLKSPKSSNTGQQSMEHTRNILQMIETLKIIFWSVKRHGDVSIAIGAFADMDHLPDFNDMVDHPALPVPRIFQWLKKNFTFTFPISCKLHPANSMQHRLSLRTTFPLMKSELMLHCIFGHTLSKYHLPYAIPNDIFCNSQILSQNCPSEPSSEEHEASLLAMENHIFDHLLYSMKLQTRAICDILHHVLEDHHFYLASNSKENTETLYNSVVPRITVHNNIVQTLHLTVSKMLILPLPKKRLKKKVKNILTRKSPPPLSRKITRTKSKLHI
jgi:hypothetical protein